MAPLPIDPNTVISFIKVGLSFLGALDNNGQLDPRSTPVTEDMEFWMEMACREFQRFTRMPAAATFNNQPASAPYPLRLEARNNDFGAAGDQIDGNFRDPKVLAVLAKWVDPANNICIPVVISAWRAAADSKPLQLLAGTSAGNLWLPHQFEISRRNLDIDGNPIGKGESARYFVLDLSGQFPEPADPALKPIGHFYPYTRQVKGKPAEIYGGPVSIAEASIQVTFSTLTGSAPETAAAPTLSTYKVISAIANAEVSGKFDELNAWDRGILSVGIYQWTIGNLNFKTDPTIGVGELGALLALNKRIDANGAFKTLVTDFGFDVAIDWTDDNISKLFQGKADRVYRDSVSEAQQVTAQDGTVSLQMVPIIETRRAEYFRGLHPFYRFQAACRYIPGFQQSMWSMARLRLRELLSANWKTIPDPKNPKKSLSIPRYRKLDGSLRPATLGETFRSECTSAMLLRAHVVGPGNILRGGHIGKYPQAVMQTLNTLNADLLSIPVNDWPDRWEVEMSKALLAQSKQNSPLWKNLDDIRKLQYGEPQKSPLATMRNFQLDDSGLPPLPEAAPAP